MLLPVCEKYYFQSDHIRLSDNLTS
ncbi:hypothetical protein AGR8A_Cc70410 [Agrobacterium fabrum str. J-07]|nr:hypothetical protein AGR8A_Cc70410 [Agrobacterium fabrum str. J-07]